MVIAYLRVSTSKQHLENQKREIIRYALARQMGIDRWVEETISGKTDRNSRALGKVIKKLRQGDSIIITEISRLSRSLHEIMLIMKHCIDVGVIIHSTKEGYVFDDSINSKVLSFAFGLAAEIEHKLISQRTREALAMRKALGKHVGRVVGSDYLYQESLQKLAQIQQAVAEGLTIVDICKKFGFSRSIFQKLRENHRELDLAVKRRNAASKNRWG